MTLYCDAEHRVTSKHQNKKPSEENVVPQKLPTLSAYCRERQKGPVLPAVLLQRRASIRARNKLCSRQGELRCVSMATSPLTTNKVSTIELPASKTLDSSDVISLSLCRLEILFSGSLNMKTPSPLTPSSSPPWRAWFPRRPPR